MDNDPFFVSAGAKKSKRWTPLASSGPKSKSKSKFKRNQHGKHGSSSSNRGAQAAKRAKQMRDEEIVSDESDNEGQGLSLEDEIRERFADDDEELSEDETLVNETAAEKRLRLAKEIIEQIEEEERDKELEGEVLTQAISHRLRQELYKEKGVLRRQLAEPLRQYNVDDDNTITVKGHRLPITSAVVSSDTKYIATGSKDGTIIKWIRDAGWFACFFFFPSSAQHTESRE